MAAARVGCCVRFFVVCFSGCTLRYDTLGHNYEMSAFPDIFLRGNKKKKNMSMSPTGPVGRILPTLSAVGDMSATCRRHAQLS